MEWTRRKMIPAEAWHLKKTAGIAFAFRSRQKRSEPGSMTAKSSTSESRTEKWRCASGKLNDASRWEYPRGKPQPLTGISNSNRYFRPLNKPKQGEREFR